MFIARTSAQTKDAQPKKVNFSYSQNPKTKPKAATVRESESSKNAAATNENDISPSKNENKLESLISKDTNSEDDFESRSAAGKTLEVAKRGALASKPTDVYRVGPGDVLFINLLNAPAKSTNYFTVLNDGTIDYPLVGEMVSVNGFTTDEIEDLLKERIKLFENPQVTVKVRDYSSHKFTVLGLVEKPGEKFLQREAVPLFVVRAEAVVQPKANRVIIKRADSSTESLDMSDSKYEDVLVFTGDIVEFGFVAQTVEAATPAPQFYYIGGNVNSLGQKDFYAGITLTQAILVSGGLKKSSVKKVVIRRKNEEGLLKSAEFNLKAIKDGQQPDPLLQAGDTIEIGN